MNNSRKRSWRHPYHNYKNGGYYFITIVTKDRKPYFGKIQNGKMICSNHGNFARNHWLKIPKYCEGVVLDDFVIMPEHIHGILYLNKSKNESLRADKARSWQSTWSQSLSSVVRGYKTGVTKYFRSLGNYEFGWVASYHDHIIKCNEDLLLFRRYIKNNPREYKGISLTSEDELL